MNKQNDLFMRRFFKAILIFFATIIAIAVILFAIGYFYGSRHFIVKENTIYIDDLPEAFDGYRILQFSDFHAGAFHMGHESDVEEIVRLINSQNCDVIFFTGDLVTIKAQELDGFEDQLSKLKAPDGVISIMGNHDYNLYQRNNTMAQHRADTQDLIRRQKKLGWNLLLNDHTYLYRGNDSIAVVGVENDGIAPRFPEYGDLGKAQAGVDSSVFKVLLSHDPTHWRRKVLPNTNIKLMLAGHTHAGQFKIFGWSPVALVYNEWSGLYEESGRFLYVNEGVGCVPVPYRIGAWPEVSIITLRKK